MTHVIALEELQSSQGTSEPITPGKRMPQAHLSSLFKFGLSGLIERLVGVLGYSLAPHISLGKTTSYLTLDDVRCVKPLFSTSPPSHKLSTGTIDIPRKLDTSSSGCRENLNRCNLILNTTPDSTYINARITLKMEVMLWPPRRRGIWRVSYMFHNRGPRYSTTEH